MYNIDNLNSYKIKYIGINIYKIINERGDYRKIDLGKIKDIRMRDNTIGLNLNTSKDLFDLMGMTQGYADNIYVKNNNDKYDTKLLCEINVEYHNDNEIIPGVFYIRSTLEGIYTKLDCLSLSFDMYLKYNEIEKIEIEYHKKCDKIKIKNNGMTIGTLRGIFTNEPRVNQCGNIDYMCKMEFDADKNSKNTIDRLVLNKSYIELNDEKCYISLINHREKDYFICFNYKDKKQNKEEDLPVLEDSINSRIEQSQLILNTIKSTGFDIRELFPQMKNKIIETMDRGFEKENLDIKEGETIANAPLVHVANGLEGMRTYYLKPISLANLNRLGFDAEITINWDTENLIVKAVKI